MIGGTTCVHLRERTWATIGVKLATETYRLRQAAPRERACTLVAKPAISRAFDGERRTRTADTSIFSRVLYQLSYLAATPILAFLRGLGHCGGAC